MFSFRFIEIWVWMECDLTQLINIICHNKSNGCLWHENYVSYKVNFIE